LGILPIAFATSLLFDTLWVSVSVTMFGEVARKAVFRKGCTIGQAAVVAVVVLVGASHYLRVSARSWEGPGWLTDGVRVFNGLTGDEARWFDSSRVFVVVDCC